MVADFKNTAEVARIIGIKTSALQRAIWDGRVTAPAKSPSGGFLWTEKDIDSASWALKRKPYEPKGSKND